MTNHQFNLNFDILKANSAALCFCSLDLDLPSNYVTVKDKLWYKALFIYFWRFH